MVNSLRVPMECPRSPFQLAKLPIGVNKSATSLIHFVCLFQKFVLKSSLMEC